MIKKAPIRFVPYLKSVIWGGEKICKYKGISQPQPKIGESWEISAVPGHESVVAEGPYEGMSIIELVDKFGEDFLGRNVMRRYEGRFPLLIKLIDAKADLSVQVHPDDQLAKSRHDCLGKSEMWYIIQADKDAKICAGLKVAMTPDEYEQRVADGSFLDALAFHDSEAGDVYYLPAGRIHAIGAGNMLAEIQESSDITYRIYDYDRRDADGNLRELHTDQAKDAIDYNVYEDYKCNPLDPGVEDARLVECEHFTTHRIILNGERKLDVDYDSFAVVMCLEGELSLNYGQESMILRQGSTVLLPAVMSEVKLLGHATILVTHS